MTAFLLMVVMCTSLCTEFTTNAQEVIDGTSQHTEAKTPQRHKDLSNPKTEEDSSMMTGQKVTWDCVWFGSYPQAEVVSSLENYSALDKDMLKSL